MKLFISTLKRANMINLCHSPLRRIKDKLGLVSTGQILRPHLLGLTVLLAALTVGPQVSADKKASNNSAVILVSIKPIHSLVAGVMEGFTAPHLLIKGAGSPHGYALKPSEVKLIKQADLIFRIGPDFETFLNKPIAAHSNQNRVVNLIDSPGMKTLKSRSHEDFARSLHEKAAHKDHDDHKDHADHKDHDDHKDHADHHDHAHTSDIDQHIWLSTENAEKLVEVISERLIAKFPAQKALFTKNSKALKAQLHQQADKIKKKLGPLGQHKFVSFHDAYYYFENDFGLTSAGVIRINPDAAPSLKHIQALRQSLQTKKVKCIFSEPQFQPKIIPSLIKGLPIKTGVLDPLGAEIKPGTDAYMQIITNMADSFQQCLN